MGIAIAVAAILFFVVAGLVFALAIARTARRQRPALPDNCGDCQFMVPRAKVYRRETLEDADGIVHYLCQKRWIEVAPYSPWCTLGRSKTRVTRTPS